MPKKAQEPEQMQQPLPEPGKPSPVESKVTGAARNPTEEKGPEPSFLRSSKANRQEIFLPVSGFIWLYPDEIEIVNHPTFQRLGRINQLGQTYVVYRGATHKRLEHALGALHMVHRMIDALQNTSSKLPPAENEIGAINQLRRGAPLSEAEQRFTRLGALLHDIGHIAAGHTVEDELRLLGKHDADGRLTRLFDAADWKDRRGRTLAECIDQYFDQYVPPRLKGHVKASEIVRLLIRKQPKEHDQFGSAQTLLEGSDEIRLKVCQDMIGNTICADLLDYLHRDWYHLGKPRSFDERILQYMEIRTRNPSFSVAGPVSRSDDRFVISLGNRPRIRSDAVSAILELLEWRYQLAESALFHRTKLAAAAMLDRALYALWGEDPSRVEEFLLPLSDEEMLTECIREAQARASHDKSGRSDVALRLLRDLQNRQLFTDLGTWFHADLVEHVRDRVQRKYGEGEPDATAPATNRWEVLSLLEDDFGLPSGSLAMYCPGHGMNAKIAEVQIAVDGEVERFSEYEEKHEHALSGGHLNAQLHRFKRLWRVHFFIDREVRDDIDQKGILTFLVHAIRAFVLNDLVEQRPSHVARSLALALREHKESKWHGRELLDEPAVAARGSAEVARGRYPFGAPSIGSYFASR